VHALCDLALLLDDVNLMWGYVITLCGYISGHGGQPGDEQLSGWLVSCRVLSWGGLQLLLQLKLQLDEHRVHLPLFLLLLQGKRSGKRERMA
jgi:hypothetical protein